MSNFALKYKSQQKDHISKLTQILLKKMIMSVA